MENMRKATATVRLRRQVSFSRSTRVVLVESLDEMTDAEMSATWYCDDDSGALQGDIVETVKFMRKPGVASSDVCTRGLEHMRSAQHLNERKYLKRSVVDAVLGEQDSQRISGVFDSEEIRRASVASSRVAIDLALTLAAADESFVRRTIKRDMQPPKHAEEEADMFFGVLESALALSLSPGDNGATSPPSPPLSAPKSNVVASTHRNASSSRISRVLAMGGQEQRGRLVQAQTQQQSSISSIDLIRKKVSSGLQDEVVQSSGKGCASPNQKVGLRAMMMRKNDTYAAMNDK